MLRFGVQRNQHIPDFWGCFSFMGLCSLMPVEAALAAGIHGMVLESWECSGNCRREKSSAGSQPCRAGNALGTAGRKIPEETLLDPSLGEVGMLWECSGHSRQENSTAGSQPWRAGNDLGKFWECCEHSRQEFHGLILALSGAGEPGMLLWVCSGHSRQEFHG